MSGNLPFDEKNSKYYCCFKKLHIRKGAQIVSIALIAGVVGILMYSFGRPPTVMVCSWFVALYALGIYGSLIYAVFKEKRKFTTPFLVFEAIFIVTCGLLFMIFMLNAMFQTETLRRLAADFGGVSSMASVWEPSTRGFVLSMTFLFVLFITGHCWCFEIIYRFAAYLEERESSFVFHLEPEFRIV